MTTVYYFFVGAPPNIATLVATLNARLLVELNLPVANYVSTVYNGGSQNVEVTYSIALSSDNELKLNNITSIILFLSIFLFFYFLSTIIIFTTLPLNKSQLLKFPL